VDMFLVLLINIHSSNTFKAIHFSKLNAMFSKYYLYFSEKFIDCITQ